MSHDANRWKRIAEIHREALLRQSSERAAFLEAACAGDSGLRREVDALLAFTHSADTLLETPIAALLADVMAADSIPPLIGGRFGSHETLARSSRSVRSRGFTPGTILIDRYRIVGLVGRGGMGEVYRADDLKLGHPVALKFFASALSADPVQRERFFAEVRITRQLSHPNICRVYDVAESAGQHFLSMEFIDGEDLASLIKRIGFLTNEKALDIARQLTAGLSAAHERGVLHRDLKPANIMIDGHGRVRITDFGIATAMGDEAQTVEIVGTPAYMAPEQLAGERATVRSDIYSLGLILYELCSGTRAFTAATITELREQKEARSPRAPSDLRSGVDPILERLIARCIERDPFRRPASVSQLAASLPGDPLAAAIAAGKTPSPEMVAAAGLKEGLQPALGAALLAFVALGLLTAIASGIEGRVFLRVPPGKSPALLTERSRDLLKNLGYSTRPRDQALGYSYAFTPPILGQMLGRQTARVLWRRLEPESLRFWYRESPQPLDHWLASGNGTFSDPPMRFSGEARIQLDTEGQLRELTVLPSSSESASSSGSAPNWSVLFSEAGLDESEFTPSETPWTPFFYADARAAWAGSFSQMPEIPIRIEAASYRGKPVYFRVMGPWSRPDDTGSTAPSRAQQIASGAMISVAFAIATGAFFLVRRNIRLGRGDRRGAARLALLFLALDATTWILVEHHVASLAEVRLFFPFAGLALLQAGTVWLLYLGLEPVIRRRWPESLVSWTRLLSGEWRDPLVGRDVLVGCAQAVAGIGIFRFSEFVAAWFGYPEAQPVATIPAGIFGPASFVALLVENVGYAVIIALGFMVAFFLSRRLLRKDWVVVLVVGSVLGLLAFFVTGSWAALAIYPLQALLLFFLSVRFGLLAMAAGVYIALIIFTSPMTANTSAWYFMTGLVSFLFIVALSLVAFRISLGGHRLLKEVED
ncbi:MAG TPA: serine/threonine-protein kinase [Thermoanaerobaculia bacterium]|nr:serine/threonine-protein kinase [Thermoanaerobaculia bacterium]